VTKPGFDAAANQIVIFDQENSHSGALQWMAGGLANTARPIRIITSLTISGR
jgi:hypothetical protein